MYTRVQIAQFVESITKVTDQRSLVNASINMALERVSQYHDWPFYLDYKNGVIKTIALYNTGTIDLTNGSTSVSGTGTTFTAAMVGRKIRVQNEMPYYRIATYVSADGAGAITLDNPYQGTTATGLSFEVFQDEYRLNADVDKQKMMRQIQNSVPITDLTPKNFDTLYPTPQAYSDPMFSIIVGTDVATYSTGTIEVASSALTTITGSASPAWTSVEGLGRGSKIRIGNNVYTVKSVDSATQLTTYESMAVVSAGAAYVITLDNIIAQLYLIPDTARLIYYRYFRKPQPLANDYDLPDMPDAFHHILLDGCLSQVWREKGDLTNQTDAENRFVIGMERMKQKLGSFAPDRISKRKSCDGQRRRLDGLENPHYSRFYSS